MDGFDGRLSYITGSILRDEDVQKDLSDGVADFMVRLNRYRAVIRPKRPPHCQSQDIHGDPITFDAFIKLRDDNMKVIENQLHGLGEYVGIRRERALLMTEAIGIYVGYPGLKEMKDYQRGGVVFEMRTEFGGSIGKIMSGEFDLDDVHPDFLFDTGREGVNDQLNQNVKDFIEMVQDRRRYYEMKRRTRTLCGDLLGNDKIWKGLTKHTIPLLEHILSHGEWLKVDNKRMDGLEAENRRLEAENKRLEAELQRGESARGLSADLRRDRERMSAVLRGNRRQ